jgi:hypothetical protein
MLLELLLPTFIQELRELKSFNERMASSFRNTTQELRTMLLLLRHNQQKIERRLDLLNPEVVVWPSCAPWVPSLPCTQSQEVTASAPAMPFSPKDHGLFCPQQNLRSTVSSTVASPPTGAPSPWGTTLPLSLPGLQQQQKNGTLHRFTSFHPCYCVSLLIQA